ncbi:MAG: 3-dehydroquinate synthase [Eubacteriales bacterium]
MREINVAVARQYHYSIIIKKGLLKELNQFKQFFFKYDKVVMVTDGNVAPIYLKHLEKEIKKMGCKTHEIIIEPGEKSKSIEGAQEIYQSLLGFNINRGDLIIALGGGVVGDLTGYCASTYLRGIDYISIPTTLLAQVDSSVGGKVGINFAKGKNLIGSFYQPKMVLIDPETLHTLPKRNFAEGMAEIIKYSCIYDEQLFQQLRHMEEDEVLQSIDEIIENCCSIKKEIVEEDEMESGLRRILNFGHTIGHVIEAYFNYDKYSHGEAVAIGMAYMAYIGEKKGFTLQGTGDLIKELLIKYHLPTILPSLDKEDASEIIFKDKKFDGSKIHLIFLKEIGQTVVVTVDKHQLYAYI